MIKDSKRLHMILTMIYQQFYIIRKGDFATDANKKIYYSLFSICLSLEEYLNSSSNDCFRIMIGSTMIWTLIETILYITNTRVIKPMYITGPLKNKFLVPKYIALFLQGFQEGGVVTTFGLYFGDRLTRIRYFILFHLFITYIIINMNSKQNISNVSSRRQINNVGSLLTMGTISIYNLIKLFQHPEHLKRQFNMFFVMTYVCSIWTYIAYIKGFRTTETIIINRDEITIKPENKLDTFFILGYDVVFEISVAYITFYNLFILHY